MIKQALLDLSQLPWMPLDGKASIPDIPGIYFAIDGTGIVQYVGKSETIKTRWQNHHKYDALSIIQVN